MSSNDRARRRAIRAEMAKSGHNYVRAARATAARPAHRLRAVCFTCRQDVPPYGGVVHVSHAEVRRYLRTRAAEREQAQAQEGEGSGTTGAVPTLSEMLGDPPLAMWQVHCDRCNPHKENGCADCYAFGVERCSTWAQLTHWTAQLVEKTWVLSATNWLGFVRAAARGGSKVGLVCHPDDRYTVVVD